VALWDARQDLPWLGVYHERRKPIRWAIIHHSGKLGRPGLEGPMGSARYVIRAKGWPGIPYHYWIPYHPLIIGSQLIVLRCNADDRRSWHTQGYPDTGLATVLQGDLGEAGPSESQLECLEALLPWQAERHELDLREALTWHSERGKKQACPGPGAVRWLEAYRAAV
jgi:hypothetical protein